MRLSKLADQRGRNAQRTPAQAIELLRAQPGGEWIGHPFPYVEREGVYAEIAKLVSGELVHPLINSAIDSAPIRDVPIAKIKSIQHTVSRARVEQYIRDPKMMRRGYKHPDHGGVVDLPIVLLWHGEHVLFDGNHRTAAQMFQGYKLIQCRFVDLDSVMKKIDALSAASSSQ